MCQSKFSRASWAFQLDLQATPFQKTHRIGVARNFHEPHSVWPCNHHKNLLLTACLWQLWFCMYKISSLKVAVRYAALVSLLCTLTIQASCIPIGPSSMKLNSSCANPWQIATRATQKCLIKSWVERKLISPSLHEKINYDTLRPWPTVFLMLQLLQVHVLLPWLIALHTMKPKLNMKSQPIPSNSPRQTYLRSSLEHKHEFKKKNVQPTITYLLLKCMYTYSRMCNYKTWIHDR